jgi:hypothetical protein
MLTALPVDDEHDLAGRFINVGDDLGDEHPYQSLDLPCFFGPRLA